MSRPISHVVGFDDAPFSRSYGGDVLIVGVVASGLRVEGVISGKVRRDGVNSTSRLIELVQRSRFAPQLQAVLLPGITFAGFNVVDIRRLHHETNLPVIALCRRRPNLSAIQSALLRRVRGGRKKWRLIEQLRPMVPVGGLFAQYVGIEVEEVAGIIRRFAVHSALPEPLRLAHLIAGGIALGESQHRA